jgi:hypothetical protein
MKKFFCAFILMFLCFCALVPVVHASGFGDMLTNLNIFKASSGLPGSEDTSVLSLVSGIINTLLSLLGLFFVILLMYAGFTYMTAQGDDKKITKAKETIRNAVIGVAIIILSYAISRIVFTLILNTISGNALK